MLPIRDLWKGCGQATIPTPISGGVSESCGEICGGETHRQSCSGNENSQAAERHKSRSGSWSSLLRVRTSNQAHGGEFCSLSARSSAGPGKRREDLYQTVWKIDHGISSCIEHRRGGEGPEECRRRDDFRGGGGVVKSPQATASGVGGGSEALDQARLTQEVKSNGDILGTDACSEIEDGNFVYDGGACCRFRYAVVMAAVWLGVKHSLSVPVYNCDQRWRIANADDGRQGYGKRQGGRRYRRDSFGPAARFK